MNIAQLSKQFLDMHEENIQKQEQFFVSFGGDIIASFVVKIPMFGVQIHEVVLLLEGDKDLCFIAPERAKALIANKCGIMVSTIEAAANARELLLPSFPESTEVVTVYEKLALTL